MADDALAQAWEQWCADLAAVGRAALAAPFAAEGPDRADGVRFLARVTAMALIQASDFSDPTAPRLFRSSDDTWRWGGPNVDNVYLASPVDPRYRYRLRGDVSGQPGVILQVFGVPSDSDPVAVRVDCDLTKLAAPTGGKVDLLLGGDLGPADGIVLPPDATRVILREYVPTANERRAGFTIERVDDEAATPPAPLSEAGALALLAQSGAWLQRNVPFWAQYTTKRRDDVGLNRMGQPASGVGMGAGDIAYAAGFWDLEADQALLLEVAGGSARYWSMQLYSLGWYESLDFLHRQTTLNGTEAFVDGDGCARFVVCATDPGVPNWLDTEGRRTGMIHYRAVWASALPSITATVVPVAEVRSHLPSDHPTVGTAARAAALRERKLLAQQRYAR